MLSNKSIKGLGFRVEGFETNGDAHRQAVGVVEGVEGSNVMVRFHGVGHQTTTRGHEPQRLFAGCKYATHSGSPLSKIVKAMQAGAETSPFLVWTCRKCSL